MGWSVLQLSLLSIWCCVSFGFLVPREDVELAVPLSGNLSNTSTHFDPTTWTLYNPIFNQTTWEAQPYVYNRRIWLTLGIEWIHWPSNSG
jgi:hypothetical protein